MKTKIILRLFIVSLVTLPSCIPTRHILLVNTSNNLAVISEYRGDTLKDESFYRSSHRPYIVTLNPHETYKFRLSYNLNDLVIDEGKHLQAEYTAQLQVTNFVEWLSPFMSATVVSNNIGL